MQPETIFESLDPRFDALLRPDSTLVRLCGGSAWAEGPVYFAAGDFVAWSDTHNDIMWRWSDADAKASFGSLRTTRTATPSTARAGSSPASTVAAASAAPSTTAPWSRSPTATREAAEFPQRCGR